MKYAIVTGTSKGLGESVARLLMDEGIHVIGISRRESEMLENYNGLGSYTHAVIDLADHSAMETPLMDVMTSIINEKPELIYLVNNAAMVEPIERAGSMASADLTNHVQLNLLAPLLATNMLLQAVKGITTRAIVANVTSGAANRSVYGWSAYCSTKAGLNRFTETVALEQEELNTDHKVILYNPGIMDTEMQADIRSADKQAFKDIETFKQYKEDNSLRSTDDVARVLVNVLINPTTIENGKQYNVKDYLS
ncbi:(S)-benzoin forming benzil reductase [Aquibacillus kalidii]|uniref:(S)-benzoin forming benzil reductase n=1 Tax=Aquibacillus kalidii TaxID=2762597 RepID=UPI001644D552|nr:(S)-benzoin forming benzil reductase [Aquibacillus kalidii]